MKKEGSDVVLLYGIESQLQDFVAIVVIRPEVILECRIKDVDTDGITRGLVYIAERSKLCGHIGKC